MAKPKPQPDLPVLLTRPQVAAYLNSSLDAVDELIHTGRLPAYRFGPRSTRIYKSDVDALLVPVIPRRPQSDEVA